jgi:hypothetical protein
MAAFLWRNATVDDRHHSAIINAIFAIVEFQFHQKFVLFEIGFVEPSKKPKKPKPTRSKKKKKKKHAKVEK